MSRQTAFPGIIIDSIEASTGKSGRHLDFDEGLPEDIPSRRIMSFANELRMFGSEYVDSELVYNLEVAAYAKSAAYMKARAFVRAKNPFEPDLMEVGGVEKLKDLGLFQGGRNAYSVTVRVTK